MDKDKILEMIEDKMTEDSKKSPNRYDDPAYIDKYYKDFAAEFRKGTMEEIIEFLDDLPDRQLEYASDVFKETMINSPKQICRRFFLVRGRHLRVQP